VYTFADLNLAEHATDATVWHACQGAGVILITGNRNAHGPETLEVTIREQNEPGSLPVLTLADRHRVSRDRAYAESAVARLFEFLVDIDNLRGAGRLFLP